ncbi:hypothetical protein RhiirA5_426151 [Rhizophagus irregularis]|uniref:Uncharacterized protein n=1 Tax=Rhizophagus irregularis TaxID=588596 RepID=A0A2I1E6G7_9GLOM|nr:hypothetical protein RhiirA5_426151 [Rhizophagus irregularis]PKY17725.1 hypothetical protein RhiirB3_430403 [Rhizophagus irregularis]CAB4463965.1 unnamed protein product [Rhizophagus irregularis]CAB5309003.1 unnamed protein product [Rhizophagus irregularis]
MQEFPFYFNKFKEYLLILLQTFLKNLQSLEFLFRAIICVNSLVALIGNFFVWTKISKLKDVNKGAVLVEVFDLFSMSILTIISGIVTATLRTYDHTIIYFITNVAFILYMYYTFLLLPAISDYEWFFDYEWFIDLQIAIMLLLFFVSVWLYWKREGGEKDKRNDEDKGNDDPKIHKIYKGYNRQKILCHAQIIVALCSQFTYIALMEKDGIIVKNPFDLLKYVTWSNVILCLIVIMMIKGVREESGSIMLLFYIASFILYGFYVYILIDAIKVLTSKESYLDYPAYIIEKKIDLIVDIISFCITTITMINSIICHKNFEAEKKFKNHLLNDELEYFKESYLYKDDIDEHYNSNNP